MSLLAASLYKNTASPKIIVIIALNLSFTIGQICCTWLDRFLKKSMYEGISKSFRNHPKVKEPETSFLYQFIRHL